MTTKAKRLPPLKRLYLGRVRGHQAASTILRLVEAHFDAFTPKEMHLKGGMTPVAYDDTVATCLLAVEGRLTAARARTVRDFVLGAKAVLRSQDVLRDVSCDPAEWGTLVPLKGPLRRPNARDAV